MKLPSGQAMKDAKRAEDTRRSRFANVQANQKARKDFILDGELSAEELVAERDRLKRECAARNPGWFS